MRKINWFLRLFMSWATLESYIAQQYANNADAIRLQTENEQLRIHIKALNDHLTENTEFMRKMQKESELLREQVTRFEAEREASNRNITMRDRDFQVERDKISRLEVLLKERENESRLLREDIAQKLQTIGKIEQTFFATTGNKGKGELGEMQLEVILSKSGIGNDFWTKNLTVGSNQVEFAIRSGTTTKWIPVDSKVLDADKDSDGNIIIDDKYRQRVQTQVKEVAKYLGKTNTADYGLLVLQNDSLYLKLFAEFPSFFEEMIRQYKVHICAPSSFVQFAWSLAHILDIYAQVHKDEKIYQEIINLITTVGKLGTSLAQAHKSFNIAMNTHYATFESRQNALVKKFAKENKLKELPPLQTTLTSDDEDGESTT